MKRREILLLSVIVLGGFLLRVYRLDENVPPLYADEVGHLRYLEWLGSFDLFDPGTWAISLYSLIFTFTWWLGLTPLGVRLPAALYGSLMAVAVYCLTICMAGKSKIKKQKSKLLSRRRININDQIALMAAGLTVVMPWSFMISRIGHTHIPLVVILSCLSAGLYMRRRYWWSLVCLAVGAYVYASLIVMAPFLLGVMGWRMWNEKGIRGIWVIGGIAVILVIIFLVKYRGLDMSSRGIDLAIWRDVNVTADSNLYRGLSRLSSPSLFSLGQDPEVGNRLVYNYPVSVVREFVENYLSFFSPEWLFLRGDSVLRHSTGQTGVFYVWMLPFMLWGAMKISNIPDGIRNPSITEDTGHGGAGKYQISNKIQNSKFLNYQTFRVLFLTWILASPIPAAITNDGAGYLLRAVTMLPFLTVFCAIGIVDLYGRVDRWNVWGKWGYVLGLVAIGLYSGYYFLFGYFHVYPALAARSYEYGFKELAEWQTENRKSMLVIWKGYYPENYFRFWQKESDITTGLVDEELLVGESRFYKTDADLYLGWPKKVEDLENFIRVKQPEIVVFPDGYLDEHEYYRRVVGILKEAVYYPDGGTAFDLYDRINSQ